MPIGRMDMTQMMGIGNYAGEVRPGPDGQLYEWVEGVDGIGNTIGFWKGLKKLASKAMPLVTKFIPGIGPVIEQVRGAVKGFCTGLPRLGPVVAQTPDLKPVYQVGTRLCNILSKAGIAGVEEGIMQARDGQFYEVVAGIGETGEVKQYLRPVWISIPVVIRPRQGVQRRAMGPMRSMGPIRPPKPAQAVPIQPVPQQRLPAGAPVVSTKPAVPIRRFR